MTVRVRAFDSMGAPPGGVPKRHFQRALYMSLLLAASTTAIAQPPGSQGGAQPMQAAGGLTIYPKNSQSEQQQSADRYACYTWATKQSGFDPSAPPSGLSAAEQSSRLGEYRRAMTACLAARGYSVQSPAAPPPAAPPPPAYTPHYVPPPAFVQPPGPELGYHPLEMQIDGGYTVAAGDTHDYLDGGGNAGLGFTWFPTSELPLGLRVDGSYTWLDARNKLLTQNGGNYSYGHEDIYGGDADLQVDLAHRSTRQKLYLFGGFGEYREQTSLKQVGLESGIVCGFYRCGPGYFWGVTARETSTSPWEKAWNAGIGWEIAIAPSASFFIEGRYQRFLHSNSFVETNMQFVPIRLGFRF